MEQAQSERLRRLFCTLSTAETELARLDVRLGSCHWAEGFLARTAIHETLAAFWNQGRLVVLQDLVLHDAGLDQRLPDPDLTAAQSALIRRRRAARLSADELRTWPIVAKLIGRRRPGAGRGPSPALVAPLASLPRRPAPAPWWEEPAHPALSPPLGFLALMTPQVDLTLDQDEDVFAHWAEPPPDLSSWPPLIAAAVRLDLWAQLEPLTHAADVGPLIVEAELRAHRRLSAAPLSVEAGRRILSRKGRRWRREEPALERAVFWLDAIALGAQAAASELDALSIAHQRIARLLSGRRSTSRLADLGDLLLRSPVVTAAHAAKALHISPQAARALFKTLGSVAHEVTGQASYRAWRL